MLELIIVLFVIGVLAALLAPALVQGRRSARQASCTNNLRQIGLAIAENMSRTPNDQRYSSGSWLLRYNQSPTDFERIGWVPDAVKNRIPRDTLLCPSNSALLSETISLENLRVAFDNGSLPSSVSDKQDSTLEAFQQTLVDNAFNTNYCQVWTMAYTDLTPSARSSSGPIDVLDPANSLGPLGERAMHFVNTSKVMMIADGLPIESLGFRYAKAITMGPSDPTDLHSAHEFESFGLVHGGGKQGAANVLFADGHVDSFLDDDRNGSLDVEEMQSRGHLLGMEAARPGR